MSAGDDHQKKSITSLLFSFFVSQDRCDDFMSAYIKIREFHSRLDLPEMGMVDMGDHEVKCVLDFSSELDGAANYDISIEKFIGAYERFLRDMLDIDHDVPCHLSALINIDESLAVFELRSPKIPSSINAFRNFSFDYWVWHLAASA